MEKYFLYNKATGNQYSDLSSIEVKKIFADQVSLTDWLYWQPHMTDWQSAEHCQELLVLLPQAVENQKPKLPKDIPPPLPDAFVLKKASKSSEPILKPLEKTLISEEP
ncbi:MAG: hypothetical protein ACOYOK_06165, partial [Pseudobdellovibrionaceae bacterium]